MTATGRLVGRRERRAAAASTPRDHRPHLRGVFDALSDPTILIMVKPGPTFVIVAANNSAQELFGFDESQIVGRRVEEVRSPGPGATTPEEYREVVERKQPITREHSFEVGGIQRVLRIVLTPILNDACVTHVLAAVSDVTSVRSAEERARRAEDRFGALVQHSSDMTLVFDEAGGLTYVSPSVDTWLGYQPEELLGVNIFDFVHPDDRDEAIVGVAAQVESGVPADQHAGVPIRVRHRDGSWRAVEGMMTDLREHPEVGGFVANVRDVTERNEAVEGLRRSEDRFRSLAESAPIGIILTNEKGDFTYVNRRFKEIFRTDVLEWRDWREVMHPDDRAGVQRAMESAVLGNEFSLEYRIIMPTGEVRWIRVSAVPQLDADGVFEGAVGTVEDITERKMFEEHLAHQATHDPLTGLPNRLVFEDRLGQALARDLRAKTGTAVLFLDLDLFKLANDRFGHAVGDRLLTEVAARLEGCMRLGDTVARIGGDEFAVVCEGAGMIEAEAIAERVLSTSREAFEVEGADVYLTASIGIAVTDSPTDVQTLMRHADAAMYRAKEGGRGRAVVYTPELERDDSQLELAGALRQAIDREELLVHYQPILDLQTQALLRLEALVRWEHPTRGLLLPADFIPAAEHAGLIVPLGAWVLEHSCRQLAGWKKAGLVAPTVRVSVNVSAHQLDHPDFVPMVTETLERVGLAPASLQLEITESVLVRDPAITMHKLELLEAMDIGLAVDDFGTGYASLMQLKRLPIHELKIDRSFVTGLGHDLEDEAIVSATIRMAHELGLAVTAEGVETDEQLERLRLLGCDDVQGFLFAPARPPHAALDATPTQTSAVGGTGAHVA